MQEAPCYAAMLNITLNQFVPREMRIGLASVAINAEMHDELPMFAIVFSVPSVVALVLWGKFNGTR